MKSTAEMLETIVENLVPGYVPISKEYLEFDSAANMEQTDNYFQFVVAYASFRADHMRSAQVAIMTLRLKHDSTTPYAPRMKRMLGEALGETLL